MGSITKLFSIDAILANSPPQEGEDPRLMATRVIVSRHAYGTGEFTEGLRELEASFARWPNEPEDCHIRRVAGVSEGHGFSWNDDFETADSEREAARLSLFRAYADWKHWRLPFVPQCIFVVVQSYDDDQVIYLATWPKVDRDKPVAIFLKDKVA